MRPYTLVLLTSVSAVGFGQGTFLTRPTIHGDQVVFSAEGDLWTTSLSSGVTRRLTSDPGLETYPYFSPDGSQIAFSGQYDGGYDAYVMSASGGIPKRLTYMPGMARVQGWAPAGQVVFRTNREAPFAEFKLYRVPAAGGVPVKYGIPKSELAAVAPNGQVVYVPTSWEWANWFRYRGGSADDLWLHDPANGSFKRLTDDPGVDTTPTWCNGAVYFVSERDGNSNLWKLDLASRKTQQVTRFTSGAVRYPNSDGSKVVFQHGAKLAVYDPSTGKAADLELELNSDRIHLRPQQARVAQAFTTPSLGPTGKRLAMEVRGQIVTVPAESGEMRVVEDKPGTRAMFPAWSADGKKLVFVSDRSGENELWVTDSAGGSEPKQLTRGLGANPPTPPRWSPDGKWIALADREARMMLIDTATGAIDVVDQGNFTGSYDTGQNYRFSPDSRLLAFDRQEEGWIGAVWLYEIASRKKVMVSNPLVASSGPSFDASGKFLVFLADTNLDPVVGGMTSKFGFDKMSRVILAPVLDDTASPFLPKVDDEGADPQKKEDKKDEPAPAVVYDLEGARSRLIQAPLPAGRYVQVEAIPGKLLVLAAAGPSLQVSGNGGYELYSFDIDKQSFNRVGSGFSGLALSADLKKLMIRAGGAVGIVDAGAAAIRAEDGRVDLSPYAVQVEPLQLWQQAFNESWRLVRDFFYDPGLHGVDWNAMRTKYQAMMPFVASRPDLTQLIKDMVSELNAGHAYVGAPAQASRAVPMGYLGADFEPVPGASAVRIKRLLRGDDFNPGLISPLLEPGMKVKEGDYILAIGGRRVQPNEDVQALLVGQRGQVVTVTVNSSPVMEGARTVRVRPLSSESDLRYQDWVMGRAAYVRKHGGENFGYAHIPNMGTEGLIGFSKGHFPNVMKDAMIYDTRFNGGGWVSSLLIENINLRPQQWWKPRHGGYWTRESWANIGYKAAICNEDNFSDGELFIDTWKRLKLGPVVGKTTGGGEVGSGGGYTLIDGGWIYVPNYAGFSGDEWLIEGRGAKPDYEVDQDPAAVMAGRDPQLDKAIELLKGMLQKHPIVKPKHPPFPKKAGFSDGG